MNEKKHVELIKNAYEAFLHKDYDHLFAIMTPEIEWEAAVGIGVKIPFGGLRKGLPAVKTYFKELEENMLFQKYEITEYVAENDKVVALGLYQAKVKPTNKTVTLPFVTVFTLKNEKIIKYEQFLDTATLLTAFQVVPALV